jgi:hypothetical protein
MTVTSHPRGKPLNGSREIANYIFGDPDKSEIVCALPREEYGLVKIGRELIGFTGWIDVALAARARAGTNRRRRERASTSTSSEASLK